MPRHYRLSNPGISSISHARRVHNVNGDGLLEIDDNDWSPDLHKELITNFGAEENIDAKDPRATTPGPMMNDDEIERAILFSKLDTMLNRKVDRRRSLPQLKEMLAQHMAQQARTAGASRTPASGGHTALTAQGAGNTPQSGTPPQT